MYKSCRIKQLSPSVNVSSVERKLKQALFERNLLGQISRDLYSASTQDEVLDAAYRSVEKLGREVSNICMFTEDGRYIQLVRVGIKSGLSKNIEKIAQRVIPGISLLGYKIPLHEESIYKKMRDTGKPIATGNIVMQDKDSVIRTTVERIAMDYTSPGSPLRLLIKTLVVPMLPYKSVIDMPIVAENKVAGAIALTSDTDLTENDLELLRTLALMAGSALERVRLLEKWKYHLVQLEKSEAKYRSLFEAAKDMIFIADLSGKLIDANPSACHCLGFSPKRLRDQFMQNIYADEADWTNMMRAIEARGSQTIEISFRRKAGATLPVEVNGTVSSQAGSKAVQIIARDLTEKKETEYELKKTNAQLIQSAKLASIGELAAGIAHELNQPLTVIKGFAQSLLRKTNQEILNKELLQEVLPVVEKNAMRMGEIIDHLRTFSRLPHTKMEAVNINQVIENALLLMGRQLELYGIMLIKDYSSQGLFCHGHPGQLEQVVLNLLSNAKDSLMERETSLEKPERAKDYKKILTIKTEAGDNGHVILSVRDNGIGIAPENLDKVFDPFFTTKEAGKGTGLGLSVSYNIVKEHRGEIEIVSGQGEGTEIRVILPLLNRSF